ncbi:MAG: hypothetical protein OEU50_15960 [Gammaproteobacteria bacterium]|nr:hypothetical protein [Gammaproteobacteria bacterium]
MLISSAAIGLGQFGLWNHGPRGLSSATMRAIMIQVNARMRLQ